MSQASSINTGRPSSVGYSLFAHVSRYRCVSTRGNGDPPHPASPHSAFESICLELPLCQAAYLNFVPGKRLSL
jgi:hypothetical protein